MSRRKLVVGGLFRSDSPTGIAIPFQTLSGEKSDASGKFEPIRSDDLMRWKYVLIFFNSMLGVFLMILELQVAWDGTQLVVSKASRTLRFLISFLTIILIIQLLDYYKGRLSIMTKLWKDARANTAFNISAWGVLQSSRVAPQFWGEAMVCLLHAPPIPEIDDKVGLLMILRFYMVFRVIKDHSEIYKNRNTIARKYSKYGIKHWGAPKFSWALSVKSLFYQHPVLFISSLTIWTLWACGHCIYIFEREYDPELFTYVGGLYLAMISMITGWPTDTYDVFWPNTLLGRAACITSTLAGLFLLSLLLEIACLGVMPTAHQRPALIWTQRHGIKEKLRNAAARIIQIVWKRYSIAQRKRKSLSMDKKRYCRCMPYYRQQQALGVQYMQAARDFRVLMRQRVAQQINYSLADVQGKDIAGPDEPPPLSVYSDEEYSYAQETGQGEVEERLKAMETMIENLTSKIDLLVAAKQQQ